jgi:hypothetical protein
MQTSRFSLTAAPTDVVIFISIEERVQDLSRGAIKQVGTVRFLRGGEIILAEVSSKLPSLDQHHARGGANIR